jgi:hypothetical protein
MKPVVCRLTAVRIPARTAKTSGTDGGKTSLRSTTVQVDVSRISRKVGKAVLSGVSNGRVVGRNAGVLTTKTYRHQLVAAVLFRAYHTVLRFAVTVGSLVVVVYQSATKSVHSPQRRLKLVPPSIARFVHNQLEVTDPPGVAAVAAVLAAAAAVVVLATTEAMEVVMV